MKTAVIVSGGNIEQDFALDLLKKIVNQEGREQVLLLAADRGAQFFADTPFRPDVVVGDFDSLSGEGAAFLEALSLGGTKIRRLRPEKDDSDTQSALLQAVEAGAERVYLLGATGGRIDHLLANLELLTLGQTLGASVILADARNYIALIPSGTTLARSRQFGSYISFFPVGGDVTGLTLRGFKYPLTKHHLTVADSGLTLSNELLEETGRVSYDSGSLLMIQSRD